MIISFFTSWGFTTGVDYSAHPDCIFQTEVEHFDHLTQTATLEGEEWNFSVKIENMEEEEGIFEKRQRKFQEFAEADEEELENFDWEGVEITEQDYNNLIVLRDFNGDHGSQIALLMKAFIKLLAIIANNPELKPIILQAFADELELVTHLSESRKALGLNGIELPEQLLK